jgi:histidinol phosphatase-like PHP family hydrolase
MCRAAGVPITLASDAHYPEQAADRHSDMIRYARAAGYREQLTFDVGGASRLVPLPEPEPEPMPG